MTRSLQLLLQLMNKYYGKQAILLLDEYDVPLAKASSHGYYEQMLEVIKAMMTTALKDNAALLFFNCDWLPSNLQRKHFYRNK